MVLAALVADTGLADRQRPGAGENLALGQTAVADDLAAAGFIAQVLVTVKEILDLGIKRGGEHVACPLTGELVKQRANLAARFNGW